MFNVLGNFLAKVTAKLMAELLPISPPASVLILKKFSSSWTAENRDSLPLLLKEKKAIKFGFYPGFLKGNLQEHPSDSL
jgi:hypothetical protein